MPRPKVCLSMIVKNESKNIIGCLESVKDYLDSYIIVDTGSTDNTVELITNFMKDHEIEGRVISHIFSTCECHPEKKPYFDYGKNRNYALSLCVGMSDYIMFMDADDRFVGKMPLEEMLSYKQDVYQLELRLGSNIYFRSIIIKNDPSLKLIYKGVLHEYLDISKASKIKFFNGDYYINAGTSGCRSSDKDKYLKDALLFEMLLEDPDCEDRSRQIFYCAQSWNHSGNVDNAIKYYKMRSEMTDGYIDERYYSYYQLAVLLKNKGTSWNLIEKICMKAYQICPDRSETLHLMQNYYREINNLRKSVEIGELAVKIPLPVRRTFVSSEIYNVHIPFLLATCYYLLGKFSESLYYCEKVDTIYAKNLAKECRFYLEKKINALVFIDVSRINTDLEKNLIILNNHYNITIVSDYFGLRYPTIIRDNISEIDYDVLIYYDSIPYIPIKTEAAKIVYLKIRKDFYMSFPFGVEAIVSNGESLGFEIISNPDTPFSATYSKQKEIPLLLERRLPISLQRLPDTLRERYTIIEHKWD